MFSDATKHSTHPPPTKKHLEHKLGLFPRIQIPQNTKHIMNSAQPVTSSNNHSEPWSLPVLQQNMDSSMCPQMALDWVPVRQAQDCFHVLQHHLKWLFIDFHEESSLHGGIILSKVVVLLDDFGFKVQGEEIFSQMLQCSHVFVGVQKGEDNFGWKVKPLANEVFFRWVFYDFSKNPSSFASEDPNHDCLIVWFT